MPIYEFICPRCKHEFEELVFKQDEEVLCPECSCKKVERALSVFSYSSGGSYHSSEGNSCDGCHKSHCSDCGH